MGHDYRHLFYRYCAGILVVIVCFVMVGNSTTKEQRNSNAFVPHSLAAMSKIERINAYCASEFIVESYFLPSHLLPSFVQWNNKTLICWRSEFKNARLKYGWFDIYALNMSKSVVDNLSFMEVGKDNPKYPVLGYAKQEEPRVLVLSDNSILNFIAGNAKGDPGTVHYYIATYNNVTNKLIYGPIVWMKYPGKQKNWIPFEHNNTVYYVQQVNPLHVVTVAHIGAHNIATTSSVVRSDKEVELHWNGTEYGSHIRGGTPAVLVRGVRLSFFHTCVKDTHNADILTYFFGAVTFCPHFPFQIHSISKVPIAPKFLYSNAKWVHPGLDFVTYPTGLILDRDGDHVWVSAGFQDRDAYVLKMNITQLYDTMRIVDECGV